MNKINIHPLNKFDRIWRRCANCNLLYNPSENRGNFCRRCGVPLTDYGVEILTKRIESFMRGEDI